jgi:hypothetical protein
VKASHKLASEMHFPANNFNARHGAASFLTASGGPTPGVDRLPAGRDRISRRLRLVCPAILA